MTEKYDKIIIGAGLYGLYSARFCGERGEKILVLEYDSEPFKRATYINQARVHQGYHYPRSLSTAVKSSGYFKRFCDDFGFCINKEFEQIYATSARYSWTNAKQFKDFCIAADIPYTEVHPERFFKKGLCDGAFLTKEYTYDALILKDYFLREISKLPNIEIRFGARIKSAETAQDVFRIFLEDAAVCESDFVLNVTYASTNQISQLFGFEPFKIKYELCEIILCEVNDELKKKGLTVMDGPFFSIMPFGMSRFHSLTSVTFTPHTTSFDTVPVFDCQKECDGYCSMESLGNCNDCAARSKSAFPYMALLARKYLRDEFEFKHKDSLFSVKPILMASEVDDSRPTVIRKHSDKPRFYSVLSGKINTIYDLDEVLING